MPLNLGSSAIAAAYLGSTAISAAYLGSDQVYSAGGSAITTLDTALVMDRSLEISDADQEDYLLNNDGTKCLILDQNNTTPTLRERTLGSAYDPSSTAGSDADTLDISGLSQMDRVRSFFLNKAGDELGVVYTDTSNQTRIAVYKSSGSDATDLSTLTLNSVIILNLGTNDPSFVTSSQMNSDGSSLYTFCRGIDRIQRWDLGTTDDLSTIPRSANSETGDLLQLDGGFLVPDESKIYYTRVGGFEKEIKEYTFTTPGDLSEITSTSSGSQWSRMNFSGTSTSMVAKTIENDSKLLVIWKDIQKGSNFSNFVAVYDPDQTSVTDLDSIKAAFSFVAGADSTYTSALEALITGLKADGVWSDLSIVMLMAVPNSIANVQMLKGSDRWELQGSLTLNGNVSVSGGSTSNYIQLIDLRMSDMSSFDSAGFYTTQIPISSGYIWGAYDSAIFREIGMRRSSNKLRAYVFAGSNDWSTNMANDKLYWMGWENNSTNRAGEGYIDGTSDVTLSNDNIGVGSATEEIFLFCRNFNGSPNTAVDSGFEMSLWFFGQKLTAAQGGDLNTRFETFLSAIAP